MKSWWDRFPERLKEEVAALGKAGFSNVEIQKDTGAGRLTVFFSFPFEGNELKLVANFPVEYPWFPPAVFGPDLALQRHLHPVSKNICLLGNPDDWDLNETLASHVIQQLPRVLHTAADPHSAETSAQETHQGEPWAAYPDYPPGPHLIISDIAIPAGAMAGRFRWTRLSAMPLRGVLMDIWDDSNNLLAATSQRWKDYAAKGVDEHGSWARTLANPTIESAERHFRSVRKPSSFSRDHELARLAATVYPEENAWRHQGDGWLLSAHVRKDTRSQPGFNWVRVGYGDDEQLFARTPELSALREKKVVLIGLGMLGSHAAIHLARMGVGRLALVDFDFVELSTVPRWALGADYAGRQKCEALTSHISRQYPWCAPEAINYRVGDALASSQVVDQFDRALREADLVLDASAEFCVGNFLSARCQELDKPHVWLWSVPGGWGGVVGRSGSTNTACWRCMKRYMDEGVIAIPFHKSGEGVQTRGCRALTATGAGIDMEETVLYALRLAAATLSRPANPYPELPWDFAVLKLRDAEGKHVIDGWTTYRKGPHAACRH